MTWLSPPLTRWACFTSPDGALYYSLLLHQVTTLERTPEEWFELGEVALAGLDEEVRLLAADAGFDPDEPLQEIFRQAKVDQDYALGLDIFRGIA